MNFVFRYSRLVALGAMGILLLCVVFAPSGGHTRFIGTLHDSAHGPIFGGLALLMLLVLRGTRGVDRMSPLAQYVVVFIGAVFLGVVTEIAQAFTHRDPAFDDIQRDAIGAAACLLLFSAFDRRIPYGPQRRLRRIASVAVSLALFGMLAMPLAHSIAEYRIRDRQFPVLLDFSQHPSRYFVWQHDADAVVVPMPGKWAAKTDEYALHIELSDTAYPGAEIIEPVADWRGYSALALDITNPAGAPLTFVVRVHDSHHNNEYDDRFNRSFRLDANQRRVFRIPVKDIEAGPTTRRMDLRNIAGMVIFRSEGDNKEMYLSRAWLE